MDTTKMEEKKEKSLVWRVLSWEIIKYEKGHAIKYVLKLILFIIIVKYVLGIIVLFSLPWIDSLPYRSDNKNLPEPLSTRGLPPPETDIPVVLPLDPGEAGKLTLAGIDSNNDGVRDDLEREIVYMYPQNEEVRRVLRAMVKKNQDFIVTEGDHEHFKELALSGFAFQHCYEYMVFPIGSYDSTNKMILWAMLRNTKERKQKDEEHQKIATPYSVTVGGSAEECKSLKGKY